MGITSLMSMSCLIRRSDDTLENVSSSAMERGDDFKIHLQYAGTGMLYKRGWT